MNKGRRLLLDGDFGLVQRVADMLLASDWVLEHPFDFVYRLAKAYNPILDIDPPGLSERNTLLVGEYANILCREAGSDIVYESFCHRLVNHGPQDVVVTYCPNQRYRMFLVLQDAVVISLNGSSNINIDVSERIDDKDLRYLFTRAFNKAYNASHTNRVFANHQETF